MTTRVVNFDDNVASQATPSSTTFTFDSNEIVTAEDSKDLMVGGESGDAFQFELDTYKGFTNTRPLVEVSGGGHVIQDSAGTDLAQRTNLQFIGTTVTDDETNDRTIVNVASGTLDSDQIVTSINDADVMIEDDTGNALEYALTDYVGFTNARGQQHPTADIFRSFYETQVITSAVSNQVIPIDFARDQETGNSFRTRGTNRIVLQQAGTYTIGLNNIASTSGATVTSNLLLSISFRVYANSTATTPLVTTTPFVIGYQTFDLSLNSFFGIGTNNTPFTAEFAPGNELELIYTSAFATQSTNYFPFIDIRRIG